MINFNNNIIYFFYHIFRNIFQKTLQIFLKKTDNNFIKIKIK